MDGQSGMGVPPAALNKFRGARGRAARAPPFLAPFSSFRPHFFHIRDWSLTTPKRVLVAGIKGPLEEGWQKKVEAFAAQIPLLP